MLHSVKNSRRSMVALSAITGLALLSGCQGHKIVAKVNGTPIEETDYTAYVSRVKANDFQSMTQSNIQTDAGGVGLVTIIKERLLDKLAAEKNIHVSDEAIKMYGDYLKRTNPGVTQAINSGQVAPEDLPRIIRDQMLLFGVGTDNATLSEDEIKKEFTDRKKDYDFPEIDGLRLVVVSDTNKGTELINEIKSNNDFTAAATKINPQAGTVRYLAVSQLPKQLQDGIANLKDGQTVSAPIAIANPTMPNSPPTYVVVQLVQRLPKGEAKLEEVHEAIRQRKLQETHPDLLQHAQKVMADFNTKANVEVFIDRYKDMVKQALLPPPDPFAGGSPSTGRPMMAPPTGAGTRPTMPSGGATAAPGGTRAPKKP